MSSDVQAHTGMLHPGATIAPPGTLSPLPVPLTALIARDEERAAIGALLRDPTARLLTLTGPGGVGKTRLAVAVAHDVSSHFPDGVTFVNLAPLSNPDLVLDTIAGALGMRDKNGTTTLDHFVAALAGKRMLLVLDNFEQVITAAPLLGNLPRFCPGVHLLITSRISLRISGEREYPVDPLPLAPPRSADDADLSGAVRLFVTRARAIRPNFHLTNESLSDIAEIVRRVDGLPLAIELAAARMKALPPAALLERMEQRLPLLSGGARDLPLRQQTMRDTIGWSYDLLSPAEQAFFRQLAIFVGGFTLDAAEAIWAAGSEAVGTLPHNSTLDAVDGITALIDHSLLLQVSDGSEPRYRMLETVREFGLERLQESDGCEEHAVRHAHAWYFKVLSGPVHEWPFSPGYQGVLTRLDTEIDNIRAALAWSERTSETELGMLLAASMSYFWMMRGRHREGRNWLDRMLSLPDSSPVIPRIHALNLDGALAAFQGDSEAAVAVLGKAIRLAQDNGDTLREGMSLAALGLAELQRGDYAAAAARTEEGISRLLLVEATAAGSPPALSRAYANLGRIAFAQDDLPRAADALEESMRRARAIGFTWSLGDTLRSLGDLARQRGDPETAMAHYRASVELAREHGDPYFLTMALAGIAVVAVAQGRLKPAVRLAAAAAALREQIGVPAEEWQHATYDQAIERARSAMPQDVFATLWTTGLGLPVEAVIAEALHVASPPETPEPASSPGDAAEALGLTQREVEVLRLVVEGLSDREIAEALFLSPRTIGWHVNHLLTKLDVSSRTAAATAAIRLGLI